MRAADLIVAAHLEAFAGRADEHFRSIRHVCLRSSSFASKGELDDGFAFGLILFNAKDPQNPSFDIRVRAAKHEPDMFYVNRCMRLVEDQLFS